VLREGKVIDEVKSYFGMRKIEVTKDAAGMERIFLNNRYNLQTLVFWIKAFWPDGLYNRPHGWSSEVRHSSAQGHGIQPPFASTSRLSRTRWYYHCDKLGMLVWARHGEPGKRHLRKRAPEFEKRG